MLSYVWRTLIDVVHQSFFQPFPLDTFVRVWVAVHNALLRSSGLGVCVCVFVLCVWVKHFESAGFLSCLVCVPQSLEMSQVGAGAMKGGDAMGAAITQGVPEMFAAAAAKLGSANATMSGGGGVVRWLPPPRVTHQRLCVLLGFPPLLFLSVDLWWWSCLLSVGLQGFGFTLQCAGNVIFTYGGGGMCPHSGWVVCLPRRALLVSISCRQT